MKWIKRHLAIIIIVTLIVHMLFSSILKFAPVNYAYRDVMDDFFNNLFRYGISDINFMLVVLVLGINYCAFYYVITLMLDFTKGVKDLVRYTSRNLLIFNFKMLKLIATQYITKFILFISITMLLHVILFNYQIQYLDIVYVVLWGICDIVVLYLIQRFIHVETLTIFALSMYFLMRRHVFNFWILFIIFIILHLLFDTYRKEK